MYLVYLEIFWEFFYTWKMEFHDLVYIFRVLLAILRQLTLEVRQWTHGLMSRSGVLPFSLFISLDRVYGGREEGLCL